MPFYNMLADASLTQILVTTTLLLLTYMLVGWLKNPIRKIPGPPGLPLIGNVLSLSLPNLHNQLYDIARKYGAVTKIYIFNTPIVVLNSTDACMQALVKSGTDFQGRPPFKRMEMIMPKDMAFQTFNANQTMLRRTFTRAMRAYGPGVAHLEKIIQETIIDVIDTIHEKDGAPVDTHQLSNGYVCCVLSSMMFGEKYNYDDEICQTLHEMNSNIVEAADPVAQGALFDLFPILLKLKFLLRDSHTLVDKAIKLTDDFTMGKIQQAKQSFDGNQKRGCLDYFLEIQQQEVDEEGRQLLDDVGIKGLLVNFISAGMTTSLSSLCQVFLDLLHDPSLQKRLQVEIDSQFEPTHTITLEDKGKLPLLEAYLYESLRYLTQVPLMVPHMTIRDTEVGGYKIPANTIVLMNSYHTSHNPDVYDKPFEVKPERFLDEDGKLVDAGHPARQHLLGFGSGRRQCPGELFAKTRMFLFLANILQKFKIEPDGALPDRDVRKYELSILLVPPPVKARFVRRQQ